MCIGCFSCLLVKFPDILQILSDIRYMILHVPVEYKLLMVSSAMELYPVHKSMRIRLVSKKVWCLL